MILILFSLLMHFILLFSVSIYFTIRKNTIIKVFWSWKKKIFHLGPRRPPRHWAPKAQPEYGGHEEVLWEAPKPQCPTTSVPAVGPSDARGCERMKLLVSVWGPGKDGLCSMSRSTVRLHLIGPGIHLPVVSQQSGPEEQVGKTGERKWEGRVWGCGQSLLHRRRTRLPGGREKEADGPLCLFMIVSGNKTVYSFYPVRDTGRSFFIWVMIFVPFQNLE